jgi:hypothetical protein
MPESTVELLGGLSLSALTLLVGSCIVWLDWCGPTSGQSWEHYCDYEEGMKLFGFVEVTVSDDHTSGKCALAEGGHKNWERVVPRRMSRNGSGELLKEV